MCTGSQHGLTVLLATLLEPGDLLLTEELTYAGLKAVAGLLRLKLQAACRSTRSGLRPDALADACRAGGAKAVYLIPTLHNPTTVVMPDGAPPRDRRRRPRARPRDRRGRRPRAAAADSAPARSRRSRRSGRYYLTSTSKTLAPGLRIAYLKAPQSMVPRLIASLRATTWAVAPLTAAIASGWIRDGTADALLAARRAEARTRQALAREKLAGADFDAQPEAYYLWLRLPEPWRADSFVAEAQARGVILSPAEAFAVGRAAVPHAVRLCIGAARTREALASGLEIVADLLDTGAAAGSAVV